MLARDGLLPPVEPVASSGQRVDFESVAQMKFERLTFAAQILLQDTPPQFQEFRTFIERESWVLDAALFRAIKKAEGESMVGLDPRLETVSRKHSRRRETLQAEIEQFCVLQFFFEMQWKANCNDKGIEILGDMPIYVDADRRRRLV